MSELLNLLVIANKKSQVLAFKSVATIEFDREFEITKWRSTKTKYGQRLVVEIQEEFQVYLPAAFSAVFKPEQIDRLNASRFFMRKVKKADKSRFDLLFREAERRPTLDCDWSEEDLIQLG